jgi:hypothetical protein
MLFIIIMVVVVLICNFNISGNTKVIHCSSDIKLFSLSLYLCPHTEHLFLHDEINNAQNYILKGTENFVNDSNSIYE